MTAPNEKHSKGFWSSDNLAQAYDRGTSKGLLHVFRIEGGATGNGAVVSHLATTAFIALAPILLLSSHKNSIYFILFLFSLFLLIKSSLPMKLRLFVATIDLVAVMPMVGSDSRSFAYVAAMIGIYAVLSLGLNIVVGFTGLLNLGYAAFYALGAYTWAIFASPQAARFLSGNYPISGNLFWLFLPIAFLISGCAGFLLGLPVLRLKGDYLAIVTLGFAEIIRLLLNNLNKPINITNGPQGISPIGPPMLFGIALNKPVHYYLIVLALFFLSFMLVRALKDSRIGRAWVAIREDELVARTMGVPVVRMKILSFSIGAALAGMVGTVFAAMQTYVDPTSFTFMDSIIILCMVILGGLGSIRGAIIGAMAMIVLQLQVLKDLSELFMRLSNSGILSLPAQFNPGKYERLIFGLIMVLMCIFRPGGILPERRRMTDRHRRDFGSSDIETAINPENPDYPAASNPNGEEDKSDGAS